MGRIYSVSPSNPELFHLRLLLTRVKGATSFESLKTVDGTICESFQAACLARGLIENDEEWKRTLQESSFWMMPKQLRRLFVRLLIFCTPVDPLSLWDEFKQKMSEDFIRSSDSELHAEKKTYVSLHKMLQYHNKHINDYFSIPEYNINFDIFHDINNENFGEEQLQNMLKKGKSQYSKMNNEQKNIVDEILNSLNHGNDNRATTQSTNKCIFIDGPAGTGKTYIYNTLFNLLTSKKLIVCNVAFTGIAATLLPQGKTVHKAFGLPVPLYSDSTSTLQLQSKEAEYLKKIDVLIWDEAPMAPKYALEIVDFTLRTIMNNELPFGGKIIILGGDFRQLLPVQRNSTKDEVISLCIKHSSLWKHFRIHHLTQNMRYL